MWVLCEQCANSPLNPNLFVIPLVSKNPKKYIAIIRKI